VGSDLVVRDASCLVCHRLFGGEDNSCDLVVCSWLKDKILSRILKFFSVAFAGYLVSVLLLYIFIENLMIDEIISKLLTLFFVLIIQFTLNKKFTFKESK
jgi:hypothetical protein